MAASSTIGQLPFFGLLAGAANLGIFGLFCAGTLSFWSTFLLIVAVFWLVEIARYRWQKGGRPGPAFTTPLGLGALCDMVLQPSDFWHRQYKYSTNGFSVNAMLGKFMVYVTDTQLCAKVFSKLDDYIFFAHPNAKWLFGPENLIFMPKEKHKLFRTLLTPGVYGKEALECYLRCQQRAIEKHLARLPGKGEVDARLQLRLMNADASQESFVGPYLSAEEKEQLSEDILTFTLGFLTFPIPLPFTGLGKAIAARHRIRGLLAPIAARAKEHAANGGKPNCVMDYWAKEVVARRSPGEPDIVSDDDMATTVLDFIFASQDATTSAVVWTLGLLSDSKRGQEVLEKLRKEVGADSLEQLPIASMIGPGTYANTCAVEILRVEPPVAMVPHLTKRDVTIDGGFVVPKGAMVIAAVSDAAQNEPNAGVFDPDSGAKDPLFNNTLVFGNGQHKCPGRMYAIQHLSVFLVALARTLTFTRRRTSKSDGILYLPTRFPTDCWYTFEKYVPKQSAA